MKVHSKLISCRQPANLTLELQQLSNDGFRLLSHAGADIAGYDYVALFATGTPTGEKFHPEEILVKVISAYDNTILGARINSICGEGWDFRSVAGSVWRHEGNYVAVFARPRPPAEPLAKGGAE